MSAGDLISKRLLSAEEVVRLERAGEQVVIAATPAFLQRVDDVRKTYINYVPESWSGTQSEAEKKLSKGLRALRAMQDQLSGGVDVSERVIDIQKVCAAGGVVVVRDGDRELARFSRDCGGLKIVTHG
jgi:hypothetical protein